MKFRSEYRFAEPYPSIRYPERIYLAGSCFSENMARKLAYSGFPVKSNSHGIVYNPLSILLGLEDVINNKVYTIDDLVEHNGRWVSLRHHGSYTHHDPEAILAEINNAVSIHRDFLQQTPHLFLTFGTAWAYTWNASGEVVANCHKIQSDKFQKSLLSVHEIKEKYLKFLALLKNFNPECTIHLTVSPVKHLRDGLHENQISKAVLLLVIHEIQELFPETFYFPAYELVTDDLRDYRFYEKDLAHPNELAIEYVWERFSEVYFREETRKVIQEVTSYRLLENHRPLDTNQVHHHLEKVKQARSILEEKYPYLVL